MFDIHDARVARNRVFPLNTSLHLLKTPKNLVSLNSRVIKKNGYGGNLNSRGDFTYEELRQKAKEFLEDI